MGWIHESHMKFHGNSMDKPWQFHWSVCGSECDARHTVGFLQIRARAAVSLCEYVVPTTKLKL